MPTLNIADLLLAIIWLFFSIRGYMRGLVKEAGSLAAIVLGFYCAGAYHKELAPHLTGFISGNYAGTAAYIILFTATLLGVWFLALAVSGMVKVTTTQWADRLFGGAFGLAKGVVLTAVLLFLIHLATPHPDFLKGSILVPLLERVSVKLARYIPPDLNDKLRKLGKKEPAAAVVKKAAESDKAPTAKKQAEPEKKPAEKPKAPPEKKREEKPKPEKKAADTEKKTSRHKKADTPSREAAAKTPSHAKAAQHAAATEKKS
ncbi:Colicin V production protein [Solidesulfovibrio fructosivorans JJ]]|uniref:Colicin V production protein n=1 Tax=Solidesulfovibrio fructosivorans JJ] TaxID=596151 RepID=E1JSC5_SOLFR|nr:CvpA family protein [Solidesulfovibrio fructosivorans]EFL52894.1 Colicin V production protein [Solidesulfovibrio fructosivorans JJ]]